jgi:hypothetical protein
MKEITDDLETKKLVKNIRGVFLKRLCQIYWARKEGVNNKRFKIVSSKRYKFLHDRMVKGDLNLIVSDKPDCAYFGIGNIKKNIVYVIPIEEMIGKEKIK